MEYVLTHFVVNVVLFNNCRFVVIKLMHFAIIIAFCNKTVAFSNKNQTHLVINFVAFCNKIIVAFCNNMSHFVTKCHNSGM